MDVSSAGVVAEECGEDVVVGLSSSRGFRVGRGRGRGRRRIHGPDRMSSVSAVSMRLGWSWCPTVAAARAASLPVQPELLTSRSPFGLLRFNELYRSHGLRHQIRHSPLAIEASAFAVG